MDLNINIQYVKGVGETRAKTLNRLGIFNLGDLITYYPREYEDRSKIKKIKDALEGEETLIRGYVISNMQIVKAKNRKMQICRMIIRDDTEACEVVWYNQPYLKQNFQIGEEYYFYGKISKKNGHIQIVSPVFDKKGIQNNTGKIIPIYPITYNISQNQMRKIIENGLNLVKGKLEETIPSYIIEENKLLDINSAVSKIHFPNSFEEFEKARIRLAFEELLTMQISLLNLKNKCMKKESGIQFDKNIKMSDIINILPFKLTKAQLRALEEIDRDMESDRIMNRLLQGDVGSGKTVVAIITAYKAVKSGYQMAIMAPTSILAIQHLESFTNILEKFNIKCGLLISNMSAKKKRETLEDIEEGKIQVVIGAHSILQDNVKFKNLGLVITDEQHRFGVNQRRLIAEKGKNVDKIVMTATPIPRTLALILYGDLDISIIDELPPNRQKIETFAVGSSMEDRVNRFIKKQIDEGRQAYIVCPLVEEKEDIDAKSVLELFQRYKSEVFREYRVEYIHGKLKQKEKDEVMEEFKNGNIDILISTTVIEVGVNVPNASVMVIQNAERFGLAALHQLRGRVGRGEYKSYCILKYQGKSDNIRERMKVMQETNDGFVISEKDLELRGSGEFFGTKQHGIPEFKVANLFEDIDMLKGVQALAIKILDKDPNLENKENILLKNTIEKKFSGKIEI